MARFSNHEKGVIRRKHSLMRYDVQIPGRAWPWDGVGCLNPQHFERGEVVAIGFVGKKRQIPVILNQKDWPASAFIPANIPPALTANWRCQHGDFQRGNSYTAATFAFADLEAKTSLATQASVGLGGSMPRFYEGFSAWICPDYRIINPEDEDYIEEIGGGDPYQFGPHLLQILPDDPDYVWAYNLATDLPEGLVTDWLTFSADTLAILDDGEVVLGWAHTFEGTTTDYLTIFSNDGSGSRKTAVDISKRRRSGADTVACGDYLCTPLLDESTGDESVHIWQISGTTLTAIELDLTGADSPGTIGVVWADEESTMPQSWVGADRFLVQDGSGGLYAINPSVPDIDWTYTGTKPIRPLVVNGTATLICAYENYATTMVTDVYDSATWDGTGGTVEDREILAEGLSTTAGLLYLSCITGNEISAFAFAGEEAFGYELGPKTEARTAHTGPSYTSPTWPFEDEGDLGWLSGWGSPMVAMRNALVVGDTTPEAPGEAETYPYATATWANALFEDIPHYGIAPVGGSGPGEAWIDEVVALFNEEREFLVQQAFEIFAARPGASHYIKRELWRNTWHSLSTTGEVYDDLHTVIGGTTYYGPPTTGGGAASGLARGVPSNYEGTEEAAAIADTEEPNEQGDFTGGGSYWIHGLGSRTYSWELVKVWSNVQEEIPLLRTPTPIHATGPAAVGLGLIVIGPPAATGINNDAHWVGRLLTNPSAAAWTFSVPAEPDAEVLTGNTWMDAGRVWVEYNTGAGWQLVGLLPDTGLPDEADPDITLDSGNVVFNGSNVHGENCEWAIG